MAIKADFDALLQNAHGLGDIADQVHQVASSLAHVIEGHGAAMRGPTGTAWQHVGAEIQQASERLHHKFADNEQNVRNAHAMYNSQEDSGVSDVHSITAAGGLDSISI
ncbi:WXG100 family type VII secretion target [Mycobacterium sp. M1]|uniref:WXG100 family type VII secretion target n=1 Tax=Mycolicibacter acidiphilus TaxID=2835306 RepID=A0ABS5RNW6_9MYCO|nr:WXG100 family type VII secretion target [Mycolicibacter acidiphilus]MBS9535987.1 WXG100 family type VII secretion target [Mycolicibacter acidiphilus]